MIKYTEYKYHAAALFTVAVWGRERYATLQTKAGACIVA